MSMLLLAFGPFMHKGEKEKSTQVDRGRAFGFVLAIFFILMLGTIAVWQIVHALVIRAEQQVFLRDAARVERLVADSVSEATSYIDSFQILFEASQKVTFGEYDRAHQILSASKKISGITSSAFAVYVPDANKQAFEEEVRTDKSLRPEGFPSFSIDPPGQRSAYLPVTYYEPYDGNIAPGQGFDYFSEPNRKAAAEKARDSGSITVTKEIDSVITNQPAFLFMAPLYKKGAALTTVDQRRAAFAGILSVSFIAETFFDKALNELELSPNINVQLYEGSPDTADPFYERTKLAENSPDPAFTRDAEVTVADQPWTVRISQLKKNNPLGGWTSSIVLLIGLFLSSLIALSVRDLLNARSRALGTAQDMIRRLRSIQQDHDEIVEGSLDPILVLDPEGRVRTVNHAFEDTLGYSRDELAGTFFADSGIVPPSSLPILLKNFSDSLSGKTHPAYTVLLRQKDGSTQMFELRAHPMLHDGKVVAVQKIFRPISERTKLLAKLNTLKSQLKETNEFIVDQERKVVALEQENAELKEHKARQS
ncbi:MAG: CHASE domain-containing protein [Candidatus Andersenbacteria bacterium]